MTIRNEDLQNLGNVFILRGIQGSGKTSMVNRKWPEADVFSTDDFFVNEAGEYLFNPQDISQAHDWNLRRFLCQLIAHRDRLVSALDDGVAPSTASEIAERHCAVVDNTNVTVAEVAPYYQAASALGFKVGIITLLCPWEDAARRQVHGVTPYRVYVNALRLDTETLRFPPWWVHEVANTKDHRIL